MLFSNSSDGQQPTGDDISSTGETTDKLIATSSTTDVNTTVNIGLHCFRSYAACSLRDTFTLEVPGGYTIIFH